MLMFDPVPIKQEAIEPMSMVSVLIPIHGFEEANLSVQKVIIWSIQSFPQCLTL